jgi:hypothetical protein
VPRQTLGRPITAHEADADVPFPACDTSDEHETWSTGLTRFPGRFEGQPSLAMSTFVNLAKLIRILEHVMKDVYSLRSSYRDLGVLGKLQGELAAWQADLPDHLVYNPETVGSRLPHHVFCIHWGLACRLLLHRPFVPIASASLETNDPAGGRLFGKPLDVCTDAADAM